MDLYRPSYHFLAPANWMNDPNGPIYYDGYYHMFYQHNPHADHWDTMHWGHARSKDLVHWEHLPIALYPSGERGEVHCYSGCCVVGDDGTPTIVYTSIGTEDGGATLWPELWIAVSADGMTTWSKPETNPILTLDVHQETEVKEWRDPYAWKEADAWYMVVGGSVDGKGSAMLYRSGDLRAWEYLGVLFSSDRGHEVWECPNFIRLGDKRVLLYSPYARVEYDTGTWSPGSGAFKAEHHGTVDFSPVYYAPNGLTCPDGRRLLWGWLTEGARGEFKGNAGWAGMLSIPRVLSLFPNGALRMEPAAELQALRGDQTTLAPQDVGSATIDTGVRGRALEIIAEFAYVREGAAFGIHVLRSPLGEEETTVMFDPATGTISIRYERSSLAPEPQKSFFAGNVDLQQAEMVRLHIFVDHSAVEVFVNDRACISGRVYPTLESSDGVYMFAAAGGAQWADNANRADLDGEANLLDNSGIRLVSFAAWQLRSIWK